jgi:hypothetical protein
MHYVAEVSKKFAVSVLSVEANRERYVFTTLRAVVGAADTRRRAI